jgi:hypothetical protein
MPDITDQFLLAVCKPILDSLDEIPVRLNQQDLVANRITAKGE